MAKKWTGDVPFNDSFGLPITDEFIDGRTVYDGRWAYMSPKSFRMHGVGLGTGKGQRYKLQEDFLTWLKVEG